MMDVESRTRAALAVRRDLPPPAMCKALREESGLSQRALGELCGVAGATVHNWEHGHRKPRGKHLVAYVEALRVLREIS